MSVERFGHEEISPLLNQAMTIVLVVLVAAKESNKRENDQSDNARFVKIFMLR